MESSGVFHNILLCGVRQHVDMCRANDGENKKQTLKKSPLRGRDWLRKAVKLKTLRGICHTEKRKIRCKAR